MTRETGFSLIEMLAALAVLAIAGVALMNALTTGIRAASLAEDAALAGLAAENVLSEQLAMAGGRAPGDRTGPYEIAGRRYDWRLETGPSGDPGLSRVTLTVQAEDGREAARLVTFVREDL